MNEPLNKEKSQLSSVRDYVAVVFRQKHKIITLFLVVAIAVTLYLIRTPNLYKSEAKLMVRLGKESVLDPTGQTGLITSITPSQLSRINTELEIIKGQELAEKIVDSLGLAYILGIDEESLPSDSRKLLLLRNEALRILMKNLELTTAKETNIILISYKSRSAERAQKVVSKLIDLYRTKHIDLQRAPGSYDFYKRQIDAAKEGLTKTEEELFKLKNELGIDSVDKQREIIWSRISALYLDLERTISSLAFNKVKVEAMKKSLDELPKIVEMWETKESILFKGVIGTDVTKRSNPIYQQMQVALLNEKATLGSLEAQAEAQRQQLIVAKQELRTLNRHAGKIGKLEGELEMQKDNYRKYLENLQAARVDEVLEKEHISNIRVVQNATYPVEPLIKSKIKIAVLGLFFAIFGGIGLAFVAESLDHTLKKPEDVEDKLNVQALAAIPAVSSNRLYMKEELSEKDDGQTSKESRYEIPSAVKKCYESIRTRLLLSTNGFPRPSRVITVTSCEAGEGSTTVASNLATMLAKTGDERVVLVDANFSRPMVHKLLGLELEPGLANEINNGSAGETIIKSCPVENLDVIAAGQMPNESISTFTSSRFKNLMQDLKKEYGYIVFDAPPIKETSSSMHLASLSDGVIMVVEAERAHWEAVNRVKEELLKVKANIIGIVLNKRRFPIPKIFYKKL